MNFGAPIEKKITTCRVCGQEFKAPAIKPDDRGQILKLAEALGRHLNTHEELQRAVTTLLLATLFTTEDEMLKASIPTILAGVEPTRAMIHQATRRTYIDDALIDNKIADLGFEVEDAKGLQTLLRDMRDILCEEGQYAPVNGKRVTL
jgi:hypothetical protein